jgi:hypothetical protein
MGVCSPAVPKESLQDIVIPLIHPETQPKTASLVQQSHEARRKAKKLLEIAKKAVEIAIKNNEEEALDYISYISKTEVKIEEGKEYYRDGDIH